MLRFVEISIQKFILCAVIPWHQTILQKNVIEKEDFLSFFLMLFSKNLYFKTFNNQHWWCKKTKQHSIVNICRSFIVTRRDDKIKVLVSFTLWIKTENLRTSDLLVLLNWTLHQNILSSKYYCNTISMVLLAKPSLFSCHLFTTFIPDFLPTAIKTQGKITKL